MAEPEIRAPRQNEVGGRYRHRRMLASQAYKMEKNSYSKINKDSQRRHGSTDTTYQEAAERCMLPKIRFQEQSQHKSKDSKWTKRKRGNLYQNIDRLNLEQEVSYGLKVLEEARELRKCI